MFIYNFIIVFTLVCLLVTYKSDNRKIYSNNLFYILSTIIILVVCLHGKYVGHDTHTYMHLYMHPKEMDFSPIESVLPWLVYFLRGIYANEFFINFCVLLLAQLPIFILINKYSCNRFLTIFLYLTYSTSVSMFLHSMTAVRQSLALGFFALSIYVYLKSGNKFNMKVYVCLLLMCMSHISALLVLPLFFCANIHISKRFYCIGCLASCVLGFCIARVAGVLLSYAVLINKDFYLSGDASSVSFLRCIPFIVPFLFIVFTLPKDKLQTIWVKGMFLVVLITCSLYPIAQNLDRICAYYYLTSCFAIPELLSVKYHSIKQSIVVMFSLMMIVYFTQKFYTTFDNLTHMEYPYVPYSTFLE